MATVVEIVRNRRKAKKAKKMEIVKCSEKTLLEVQTEFLNLYSNNIEKITETAIEIINKSKELQKYKVVDTDKHKEEIENLRDDDICEMLLNLFINDDMIFNDDEQIKKAVTTSLRLNY